MKLLLIMLLPALILMGTSAFAQVSSFPYSQAFGSDPLGGTDWSASKIGTTSTNWVYSTIDGNSGGCLKLTGYIGAVGEESYLDLALNTSGKTFTSGETYSYDIFRENGALGDATVVVQENSSGSFVDIAGSSFTVQSLTATTWTTKSVTLPSSMGNLPNVKIRLKISNTGVTAFNSLRYDNASVDGGVLPVELTSFTARVLENKIVNLSWRTATEVNNYGFQIERRAQGSNDWQSIGLLQGYGTSNVPHDYTYLDEAPNYGRLAYRLKQIDRDGSFTYSNEFQVTIGTSLKGFVLLQNFPNPFNPKTNIVFSLPEKAFVRLLVYNALGQRVTTLAEQEMEGGVHRVELNADNWSSGVYYYRLETPNFVQIKKLLFVK
jgi:hypothetical protein